MNCKRSRAKPPNQPEIGLLDQAYAPTRPRDRVLWSCIHDIPTLSRPVSAYPENRNLPPHRRPKQHVSTSAEQPPRPDASRLASWTPWSYPRCPGIRRTPPGSGRGRHGQINNGVYVEKLVLPSGRCKSTAAGYQTGCQRFYRRFTTRKEG